MGQGENWSYDAYARMRDDQPLSVQPDERFREADRTAAQVEPADSAPADPRPDETASPVAADEWLSPALSRDLIETCLLLLSLLLQDHPDQPSSTHRLFGRLVHHARILASAAQSTAPESAPSKTETSPSPSAKEDEIQVELLQIFWAVFWAGVNVQMRRGRLVQIQVEALQTFLAQRGIHE